MTVLARLWLDNTVAICVEAEGHYNWLHTSACSVWEYQASVKQDKPLEFKSSFVLIPCFCTFVLDYLGVFSMFSGWP